MDFSWKNSKMFLLIFKVFKHRWLLFSFWVLCISFSSFFHVGDNDLRLALIFTIFLHSALYGETWEENRRQLARAQSLGYRFCRICLAWGCDLRPKRIHWNSKPCYFSQATLQPRTDQVPVDKQGSCWEVTRFRIPVKPFWP